VRTPSPNVSPLYQTKGSARFASKVVFLVALLLFVIAAIAGMMRTV
jgi:uncharacterized membrane protein YtjA (UPF0391 family)